MPPNSGHGAGGRRNDYDDDVVEVDASVTITSRSQAGKRILFGWMLIVAGLAVVLLIYLLSTAFHKEPRANPELAPVVEDGRLQQAAQAGCAALRDSIASIRKDGEQQVRFEEVPSLEAALADMRAQKRADGTCFNPGSAHTVSAGTPLITRYFVLHADLKKQNSANPDDIEYLILRVYRSEDEANKAYNAVVAGRGQTKICSAGRYAFFQHTNNIDGPAFKAIAPAVYMFTGAFQKVLPPPDSTSKIS